MNLPNKLTVLRVILVPFFLAAIMIDESILPENASRILAAVLFAVTSITDFVDGQIARRCNLVTNFGKFLDPLADKIMIISALLGATARYEYLRSVLVWITLIVVIREFAVTSLRLIASGSGVVIAAIKSGKLKTASQCFCILAILLEPVILPFTYFKDYHFLSWFAIILMTVFTIYSGIEYFVKYKQYLKED